MGILRPDNKKIDLEGNISTQIWSIQSFCRQALIIGLLWFGILWVKWYVEKYSVEVSQEDKVFLDKPLFRDIKLAKKYYWEYMYTLNIFQIKTLLKYYEDLIQNLQFILKFDNGENKEYLEDNIEDLRNDLEKINSRAKDGIELEKITQNLQKTIIEYNQLEGKDILDIWKKISLIKEDLDKYKDSPRFKSKKIQELYPNIIKIVEEYNQIKKIISNNKQFLKN